MATREAKRAREVAAASRIDTAVTSLAGGLGLELPERAAPAKDPELRAIQEWEWLATVLERAVTALECAQGTAEEDAGTERPTDAEAEQVPQADEPAAPKLPKTKRGRG